MATGRAALTGEEESGRAGKGLPKSSAGFRVDGGEVPKWGREMGLVPPLQRRAVPGHIPQHVGHHAVVWVTVYWRGAPYAGEGHHAPSSVTML